MAYYQETISKRFPTRLVLWTTIASMTVLAFATGALLGFIMALRMLFPIAESGFSYGLIGLTHAAATDTLYSGDVQSRLTMLKQMKQALDAPPGQPFDAQSTAWIHPAIEHCRKDANSEIAALAAEIITTIENKKSMPLL